MALVPTLGGQSSNAPSETALLEGALRIFKEGFMPKDEVFTHSVTIPLTQEEDRLLKEIADSSDFTVEALLRAETRSFINGKLKYLQSKIS